MTAAGDGAPATKRWYWMWRECRQGCARCNGAVTRDRDGERVCSNCGLVTLTVDRAVELEPNVGCAYEPGRPPSETGYYVDNPSPHAGHRDPAYAWVPPRAAEATG